MHSYIIRMNQKAIQKAIPYESCLQMSNKEKSSAHFQDLNLSESKSHVGVSRITYVNFDSPSHMHK